METLTTKDFARQRLRRDGTWAVMFGTDWCPYCRSFRNKFAQLAQRVPFQLAIGDVTDEANPLWDRFKLKVVPTLVAFRDGKEVWRRDGQPGRGLGAGDLRQLRLALNGSDAEKPRGKAAWCRWC